jgi:hypothetical protein
MGKALFIMDGVYGHLLIYSSTIKKFNVVKNS